MLHTVDRRVVGGEHVSILTRPEGRVLLTISQEINGAITFQSSPGPKAGCSPAPDAHYSGHQKFQSSPGPKAGCSRRRMRVHGAGVKFQSSPGPKAGCSLSRNLSGRWALSRFQSSPGPKAGCSWHPGILVGQAELVSILTRPEGRVLPEPSHAGRIVIEFQSSPGPKAGCSQPGDALIFDQGEFQSSPGPKAGCSAGGAFGNVLTTTVSILTRPEGRVLLGGVALSTSGEYSFQSSPGPKAGCSRSCPARCRRRTPSFNPHPARRPGAPAAIGIVVAAVEGVSILTRPEGRVLLHRRPSDSHLLRVSILTRPEGRVLRLRVELFQRVFYTFQSSPGPKAGCSAAMLNACRSPIR